MHFPQSLGFLGFISRDVTFDVVSNMFWDSSSFIVGDDYFALKFNFSGNDFEGGNSSSGKTLLLKGGNTTFFNAAIMLAGAIALRYALPDIEAMSYLVIIFPRCFAINMLHSL